MGINFRNRDIITIDDFSRQELEYLIQKAQEMKKLEKSGQRYQLNKTLEGKKLASLFYENSTRTRTSFETAMHELGGTTFGFAGPEGTSLMKKENILATVMMYWANHADAAVMRHSKDGSVQWAADVLGIPVINGGDGKNEHPTQALLDLVTIDELVPGIDGLNIGFGGDLAHGRTIRSNALALSKFNNITIHWAAADELAMPEDLIDTLKKERGVKVKRYDSVEDVFRNSNIYYMTRPQKERIKGLNEAQINDILEKYKIDMHKILSNPNIKILHPMPVDSSTAEIDITVFFSGNQYFIAQAENGVFLRKALLYEILNETDHILFNSSIDEKVAAANDKDYITKSDDPNKKSDINEKPYVGKIDYGVVIDHLEDGITAEIEAKLQFSKRGYRVTSVLHEPSTKTGKLKDFLKIKDKLLTPREIKEIAMISPNATFNIIKDRDVVEKFKYNLCKNENCITRVVNEDVPPKFDKIGKDLRCHYCRKPYEKLCQIIQNLKNS